MRLPAACRPLLFLPRLGPREMERRALLPGPRDRDRTTCRFPVGRTYPPRPSSVIQDEGTRVETQASPPLYWAGNASR